MTTHQKVILVVSIFLLVILSIAGPPFYQLYAVKQEPEIEKQEASPVGSQLEVCEAQVRYLLEQLDDCYGGPVYKCCCYEGDQDDRQHGDKRSYR